ncbi:histidine phosphatase family protein [Rhizobium halophytocola]|uniref:Broad specificity phosphatase PhoE n=1 Tax=Rhizobium halophytocola TaxID=735519 RepID=A0ABS4E0H0_9HYPH|nr:histidine phosphatase family protein [Rhizobium halophytocola]MBP1851404.1 broad specificity phosphatase PhoE [Rhizobium halophytocola]
MFGLYITHPQVRIDPDVPVPQWGLSDLGAARTRTTAQAPWVRRLRRIVSSDEVKAVETAGILARAAGVAVEIIEGLYENDRSTTGFMPPPEFEAAADRFFAAPDQSSRGWERAVDAQARIVAQVTRVLADHDPQAPIAFVGHGGVGTLLRCHMAGRPIARSQDQPPGGGNLFAFFLADLSLSCDWTAMESWQENATWKPVTD